ncbi:MAG: hypothetical protein MUC40_00685 [Akkermansiaceae bacterium]|jgi:hypothetical protein|nr:hypothetical protein [Akkermansiaceae bacterium]
MRGMGFSKPKAITPEPAPPPVTTTGEDKAYAEMEERKKQRARNGYDDTLQGRFGTLLAPAEKAQPRKKTLLGA